MRLLSHSPLLARSMMTSHSRLCLTPYEAPGCQGQTAPGAPGWGDGSVQRSRCPGSGTAFDPRHDGYSCGIDDPPGASSREAPHEGWPSW